MVTQYVGHPAVNSGADGFIYPLLKIGVDGLGVQAHKDTPNYVSSF